MPLRTIAAQYPRIADNRDGSVTLTLGKIQWIEDALEPLLNIEDDEAAIKEHARMWCVRNGFETYAELLADPVKLAEFHAMNETMMVRG